MEGLLLLLLLVGVPVGGWYLAGVIRGGGKYVGPREGARIAQVKKYEGQIARGMYERELIDEAARNVRERRGL